MITIDIAQQRLKGYIKKYYCEVRDDVFDWGSFQTHLYGYIVSLSHQVAYKRGWQGHNWRQEMRKQLLSFAYDEIDKMNRARKTKKTLIKIFTFGLAK